MNLESLFKWKGELTILDATGEPVIVRKKPLVLHQRIIGDAELMQARKEAVFASRGLRKKLRDQASTEALIMLPDHEDLGKETLATMLVFAETLTLRRIAGKQAKKPKRPVKPKGDVTLEQQEKYETALEEYSNKVTKAIEKELEKVIDLRRSEAMKLDREQLVKLFLESTIDSLCHTEMLSVFNTWCAYLGTYSDKPMTKRAFKSFDAFDNASPDLKEQIIGGYITLDFGGEDLKN